MAAPQAPHGRDRGHGPERRYPAIELEDGTWYREQSAEMEKAIRAGPLRPGTAA